WLMRAMRNGCAAVRQAQPLFRDARWAWARPGPLSGHGPGRARGAAARAVVGDVGADGTGAAEELPLAEQHAEAEDAGELLVVVDLLDHERQPVPGQMTADVARRQMAARRAQPLQEHGGVELGEHEALLG